MLIWKRLHVMAGVVSLATMALSGTTVEADWVSPISVPYSSPDYTAPGRGFGISTLYDLLYGPTAESDNAAVMLDDTPSTLAATGHLVFDLGTAQEIGGAQIWSRVGADAFPKNIDLFYFADDNPANHVLVDDIEGDADIMLLNNYSLPLKTYGDSASVSFGATITKRYLGIRLNDSWDSWTTAGERGNQIQEVMFWRGSVLEPQVSNWYSPAAIYSHSYDGSDYPTPLPQYAAGKSIDSDTGTFTIWFDDTTNDFPNIEGNCSGYVVFDLGESKTVYGARIFARNLAIEGDPVFPKDVDFFYFSDDAPQSFTSSADIQIGAGNIVEAGGGTLLNTGLKGFAEVVFPTAITGRYIGLKLNETYTKYFDGSNQTSEIMFTYSSIPNRWKWTGANGTAWTGENNWLNGGGSPDTYVADERVTFDDTAAGTTVDVSGADVTAIEAIVFDNADKDFIVEGTNGIAGSISVVKKGGGKVTLNGNDTYTGLTYIENGTLQFGPRADGDFNVLVNAAGVQIDGGKLIFDYSTADSPAAVVKDSLTNFYVGLSEYAGSGLYYLGPIRTENGLTDTECLGWRDDPANSTVNVMWTLYGDTNLDGDVDSEDMGNLLANLDQAGDWEDGDFNYDGMVDADDVDLFEANYGPLTFKPGDADRNGKIDAADAAALATNWLTGPNATWSQGDFNKDGYVNDIDAALMAANWTGSASASVPEPSVWVALLSLSLGAALLILRKA